ncbi:hypothetical protein AZ54_00995 [Xanthomonas oryzae pv. oryzae PXO86]|nr:hypothetical protein AZ54_00995 [Xanthomonas oryzae pv. oryzae PXO86]
MVETYIAQKTDPFLQLIASMVDLKWSMQRPESILVK